MSSHLWKSAPLISTSNFLLSEHNPARVLVELDSPLRGEDKRNVFEREVNKSVSNHHHPRLLALGAQLEIILAKAKSGQLTEATQTLMASLSDEIVKICSQFSSNPLEYLQKSGFAALFPSVSAFYFPTTPLPSSDAFEEYFVQIALMNQTMFLATQLRNDISALTNHKYIAHQLALLYQCLAQCGIAMEVFKKRIEERFEEIKAATESDPKGVLLSDSQRNWIQDLTNNVLGEMAIQPAPLLKRLRPVLSFCSSSQ
eukprot:TRINITY_DN6842_c0_g1_i1.p1 TRINITY_DN6842_c0_g1~~TRINITY_DN6842_c0_g1_i1.p1  ORF type:complete len:257 (-),score=62.75 TRINITY_DN6842_c0_g1_i1:14-784(-)